jgi:hypothetical protein
MNGDPKHISINGCISSRKPGELSIRHHILRVLSKSSRALADSEICSVLTGRQPFKWTSRDIRNLLCQMAADGVLDRATRATTSYAGYEFINEYYWVAGHDVSIPGIQSCGDVDGGRGDRGDRNACEFVHPDIDGLTGLSCDCECVLAAASIVSDMHGRLNLGPLAEAAGIPKGRATRAVKQLRLLGSWPYRWRYGGMADEEARVRLEVARKMKVARCGDRIEDDAFDLAYGEGEGDGGGRRSEI